MSTVPSYWKSSLSDITKTVSALRRGRVIAQTQSAGGRNIDLVCYGEPNDLHRTANLSCALGAGDRKCYADKDGEAYRPTLLLAGCIHGGEFEGTMALLNLISILETGADIAGTQNEFLYNAPEYANILIIPCLNPDGRSRIPFDSMVGRSFEELRYYNQGTWSDGSLCGWPECKKIHPMKGHCKFLGAYFNDDGINMMHDDFFGKKANETQFIFDAVDKYVPDFTVLLHGGTNVPNCILKPSYSPDAVKQNILELENNITLRCDEEGILCKLTPSDCGENNLTPSSFNLVSALYQLCGEPCVTYESNQGLTNCGEAVPLTYDEIYRSHIILFEEAIKHIDTRR